MLGIFSAFTLPYVLGPAAPEMMGPFMQRTFRDLNDPTNGHHPGGDHLRCFCIVFGLFYVRSVARNRSSARWPTSLAVRRRRRIDWTGIVFAVVLTLVIVFPLLVVGTWAFTNVWRYPVGHPAGVRAEVLERRRWRAPTSGARSPLSLQPRHRGDAAFGDHLPAGGLCLRAA